MIRKEFIQAFRDPKMIGVVFVTPLIQLMLFGYAVSTDVKNVRLGVFDLDNSVISRDLISRFIRSGYFEAAARINSDTAAQKLIDSGAVRAIVHINDGFGADIESGRSGSLQIILDGSDSNTARIVMDYAGGIARAFSAERLSDLVERKTGQKQDAEIVHLESRAWFNENLESRTFYIPGVVASLLAIITLILTSMAVVREKEIGTLEQIIATPIRRTEFILGKSIPFALIGYIDAILIIIVGTLWFDIPVRGSLFVLFLGITLYLMSTIGVGLLISTVSGTQQQAMMGTFMFFNPAMLLSGFMFPIANMPYAIQLLTYLNPMRYILVIVRGVFLKGIGMEILWPQMLALLILGVATLTMATTRMHKTMA
jgi:ABC-2 type transport system permease protein